MSAFKIFGILFLVIGGVQSLTLLSFMATGKDRRINPVFLLFLCMGCLFVGTGIWMMQL